MYSSIDGCGQYTTVPHHLDIAALVNLTKHLFHTEAGVEVGQLVHDQYCESLVDALPIYSMSYH